MNENHGEHGLFSSGPGAAKAGVAAHHGTVQSPKDAFRQHMATLQSSIGALKAGEASQTKIEIPKVGKGSMLLDAAQHFNVLNLLR